MHRGDGPVSAEPGGRLLHPCGGRIERRAVEEGKGICQGAAVIDVIGQWGVGVHVEHDGIERCSAFRFQCADQLGERP